MRDLAARLRDIVRQDGRPRAEHALTSHRELTYVPDPDAGDPLECVAGRLGGTAVDADGACIAIDHLVAADRSHGRKRIDASVPGPDAPIHLFDARVASHASWWRRVVFFDIETTGLSGGAGTLAFLAGCGWFDESGFRVRQFFLAAPSGERAMLDALTDVFSGASMLVTYNGRTFDVPFMETRWAFHRAASPADDLLHFDMLPPARRLWSRRETATDDRGCSLSALERAVLDVHRVGDVPGFEIPTRYFQFLRTGEAALIDGVLEHNRQDLVSLAVIMSHALWLAREGPEACREPSEQLALGRLYERAGETVAAERSYEMAAQSLDADVRRHALAHLAERLRRDARYDEAAEAWQQVLDMAPVDGRGLSALDRRAVEALAIHHEHRAKDPMAARRYAETLVREASARTHLEVDRRIRRIDRKIATKAGEGILKI